LAWIPDPASPKASRSGMTKKWPEDDSYRICGKIDTWL